MPTTIGCVHRAHQQAAHRHADLPRWRSTLGLMLAYAVIPGNSNLL